MNHNLTPKPLTLNTVVATKSGTGICEGCGMEYIKVRHDQRFCSHACFVKNKTAEWTANMNPEKKRQIYDVYSFADGSHYFMGRVTTSTYLFDYKEIRRRFSQEVVDKIYCSARGGNARRYFYSDGICRYINPHTGEVLMEIRRVDDISQHPLCVPQQPAAIKIPAQETSAEPAPTESIASTPAASEAPAESIAPDAKKTIAVISRRFQALSDDRKRHYIENRGNVALTDAEWEKLRAFLSIGDNADEEYSRYYFAAGFSRLFGGDALKDAGSSALKRWVEQKKLTISELSRAIEEKLAALKESEAALSRLNNLVA